MDQPPREEDRPDLVRPYLPPEGPPDPVGGTPGPPPGQSPGPPPGQPPYGGLPHREPRQPAADAPPYQQGRGVRHADGVNTLRPYLLTAGRVRPLDETLEIEAQVVATPRGLASQDQLAFEHRDIVVFCAQPVSVAEIGARLGLHIGVTRVLVGDLAALGYLSVARPRPGAHRDVDTIERVIRGLESLR